MLSLINDILDITKIESGKIELQPDPFSVTKMLDKMVSICRQRSDEKNQTVDVRCDVQHETVIGDAIRINQIYMNILTNAIKYTKSGGHISVALYEESIAENAEKTRLIYVVADNGIGMTEEFVKTIFDRFSRAVDTRVNTIQGAGLGMSIAKQLTDLMDGTIDVVSKPDVDSTFTVRIDLPIAETPVLQEEEKETDVADADEDGEKIVSFPDIRVLVAEDNDTKHILAAHNYDTLEAGNGQIALDMMLSGKYPISLVLLDLTMPVMNGYELLDQMNKHNILTSIPVIVTTGNDKDDSEVLCLEKGASDFIPKPYNEDIVCHRIESIFRLIENTTLISELELDHLTGIYTREAFYRHAQDLLDENPGKSYDLICSNIESFKVIDAKYGVRTGDELLKQIAKHNIDNAGDTGISGRFGADNFVVLRESTPLPSQDEAEQQFYEDYKNAPVIKFSMQFGIYQITDRSKSISEMCDCAELALASIKHKYGVIYGVYDESMRQNILREHQLTIFMEQALSEKQFIVYLQPKHNVETGEIAGAEALVRWIHPELGFISPGEFIPLFERTGFITKLDRYVWNEVCVILKRWIDTGITPIPISVNASRADFSIDNLPEVICNMVDSYGIPHHIIHFEVTESAYTDNPKQIINTVKFLRSMGFLIEMDDFGSGYSSLNMLSELPIDILKLDMKFMQKNGDESQSNKRSILSFTVSLSKWMQLPTVAEGVETAEEVELLKTMGCDYIQGYYFAKPMPVPDFEQYMAKNKEKAKKTAGEVKAESKAKEIDSAAPSVLVVEYIDSNREMLVAMLSPQFHVYTAANGKEALDFLSGEHPDISCMVLDLLMPVMDGFQLLEQLRKDGILQTLPVIITTESGIDGELRTLRLGADSFVPKPYNAEILLHHVTKAVHEYRYRKLFEKI